MEIGEIVVYFIKMMENFIAHKLRYDVLDPTLHTLVTISEFSTLMFFYCYYVAAFFLCLSAFAVEI